MDQQDSKIPNKMSSSDRELKNPFEDWNPDIKNDILRKENGRYMLQPSFEATLKSWRDQLVTKLESSMELEADWEDGSVYTGTAGLIMLYLHLHTLTGNPKHLERACELERRLPARRGSGRRQVTLLCGEAGQLAVTAVLHHRAGRADKAQRRVKQIVDLIDEVEQSASLPDELLYGRAGYLATLLYIRQEIGGDETLQQAMKRMVAAILSSGERLSARERSPCPLMFAWHEKHYLGAAHGLSGIMTMLMQVPELVAPSALSRLVRPTVEFLAGLRLPSGNYPSSLESATADRLVHWCHGAPGFAHMLCAAYKTFSDEKYLELARRCGDVVWRRGLLRKGYGLCHGAAGNAYTFLHLYQVTQEPVYLYRAARFAEWCSQYGKHGCRTPDRPVSLFEGLAGAVYLVAELARPQAARFPGFCF